MAHNQWVIDLGRDLYAGRLDGDGGGSHVGMPRICRVPAKLREMNEKAYQPEMVSIGPYHHGEEQLQAMEKHKRRALLHFLRRSNQKTPEACLDMLRLSWPEIMADYDNLDQKWKDDEDLFLELILTDGCFILEILLTSVGVVEDYDKDDTIFGRRRRFYNAPSIRRDLLLIENQIPLLVLRKLFAGAKIKGYEDSDGLIKLLLEFLPEYIGRIGYGKQLEESLHILDLYRRRFIFGDEDSGVFNREEKGDYSLKKYSAPKIPSAMALRDHGILLRKVRTPVIWLSRVRLLSKVLSVGFRSRVLDLPELTVDDTTESVFLNAMVFESVGPVADARFTSYVCLLSNLMVSAKDANLLSTHLGIIRNGLEGDQALVDLFRRRLYSANFHHDYRLFLLQMMINEYCDRGWNRFRAYMNLTYFTNPWAQLSILSAVVLFVLTATQTFYSVYQYYKN